MSVHQPTTLRILALGAAPSAAAVLLQKLAAINAKHGPFDACVVVGDLFAAGGTGEEIAGLSFPVPTYFTVGQNPLPPQIREAIDSQGPEITSNLVFLGRSAVLTTPQGLKIGCIGGGYDASQYTTDYDPLAPLVTEASVANMLSQTALLDPDTSSALATARDGALPSAFQGLDLLLFSAPPPFMSLLSPYAALPPSEAQQAPPFADVIKRARPRYIFWPGQGEAFWEREPFGWANEGKEERWTRAVRLGGVTEPKKNRWFYAFTLPPQTPSMPIPERPANATPNPLVFASLSPAASGPQDCSSGRKRGHDEEENGESKRGRTDGDVVPEASLPHDGEARSSKPPPGYVCNICQSPDHFIRECPNRGDVKPREPRQRVPKPGYVCKACGREGHFLKECPVVKERDARRRVGDPLRPDECWFCLSNPKVTKHLIVAIGNETYVTLPKGQVVPTQGGAKPLVPGGGHVMIIPIAHHPTLLSIPAEDALPIISELEAYKTSLRQCYAHYNTVPITFEVGRLSGRGGHAHVQVVPVPLNLKDKAYDAFRAAGEHSGLEWEDEPERALAKAGPLANYFKVELPDGRTLVHMLKGHFDLQFGRMVVAGLLGVHERADWKVCVQTEDEDKEDAKEFKKALTPFLPK
ncbi:hypothetical protein Q5752_001313 [Cryptotrichosporon argae]